MRTTGSGLFHLPRLASPSCYGMVLLVEEQELLIDSKSDVLLARILEASQGMLHDRSSEFASGRPVINPPGVLPILQQEFAVTDLAAGVGLGTEACTTCVALGLVAPSSACLSSSSTLAFAHLDRVEVIERAVENLSATLDDPTAAGTLDTYIVGGYVGCTGQEMSVMHSLVRALSKSKRAFRIQLCCTGALNTDEQGLPRARSLAIHSRAETGPYPQQVRYTRARSYTTANTLYYYHILSHLT